MPGGGWISYFAIKWYSDKKSKKLKIRKKTKVKKGPVIVFSEEKMHRWPLETWELAISFGYKWSRKKIKPIGVQS